MEINAVQQSDYVYFLMTCSVFYFLLSLFLASLSKYLNAQRTQFDQGCIIKNQVERRIIDGTGDKWKDEKRISASPSRERQAERERERGSFLFVWRVMSWTGDALPSLFRRRTTSFFFAGRDANISASSPGRREGRELLGDFSRLQVTAAVSPRTGGAPADVALLRSAAGGLGKKESFHRGLWAGAPERDDTRELCNPSCNMCAVGRSQGVEACGVSSKVKSMLLNRTDRS